MTEQEQRELVVKEALSWIGTPYHHQAMVKGSGVDCAMILIGVYKNCGLIDNVKLPEYSTQWHLHRDEEKYLETISQYLKPTKDPKPGDVALFKFGRTVSHSAILIDYPTVVHAYNRVGVILDDMTNGKLKDRLHGFYTYWSA
jgi:NlpC/P60 family putative phage cell wall peptidase